MDNKTTVSANRRQVILSEEYCKKAENISKESTGKENRSEGIRIALDFYEESKNDTRGA